MPSDLDPTDHATLRQWVHDDFGLDLTTIDDITHGADFSAQLWRGGTASSGSYAVKLSGGGSPAGLVVTAELAGRGIDGIAAPVRTRHSRLWSERAGGRLSVLPWVSDERALGAELTDGHWRSLGVLLAAVHATGVSTELETLLPPETHTHAPIAAAVGQVAPRLSDADDLTRALTALWQDAGPRAAVLLERADALGAELRTRPPSHVVCHGDPHLGNIMLGRGDQVWLIDWDDAVLAPRERDLMFVTGGVLAFAPVTAAQQSAFFDGYGPVEPDPVRLAYHLCVRALDDISSWAAQVADVHSGPVEDRADALAIVRGLLGPNGLLTLAEEALRDPTGRSPCA